jgi:Conserved TM helix
MNLLAQTDNNGIGLGPVREGLESIALFVPKLLGFLAILIIGYFLAKIIAKVVDKILERVGFDRAVEKGGLRKALAKSQYDPSDILSKIVFYALFLIVLTYAFNVFGPNPVSDLLASVIAFLPKVFIAIVILVVTAAIATAARELVVATLGGLSYGKMLGNLAAGAILFIGLFMVLDQLQIAEDIVQTLFTAILAVIAGSAIIAIGGGGIQPMRGRWEAALNKYDQEKDTVRDEVSNTSTDDLKQHAQQRKDQLQSAGTPTAGTPTTPTAGTPTTGAPTIQLPEDQSTRRV